MSHRARIEQAIDRHLAGERIEDSIQFLFERPGFSASFDGREGDIEDDDEDEDGGDEKVVVSDPMGL